jgi:hypothetical protein
MLNGQQEVKMLQGFFAALATLEVLVLTLFILMLLDGGSPQ